MDPEIPNELWMFWVGSDGKRPGHWVVSVDDAPGGQTYLVAFTEAEAKTAATYQEDTYECPCTPIRVK